MYSSSLTLGTAVRFTTDTKTRPLEIIVSPGAACYITLCILFLMLLIRRQMVDSDMGMFCSSSFCWISTIERFFTRRLNTASSSSVKLHSRRKRSHSGAVNSVLMFKGASPLFLDLSPLGFPLPAHSRCDPCH